MSSGLTSHLTPTASQQIRGFAALNLNLSAQPTSQLQTNYLQHLNTNNNNNSNQSNNHTSGHNPNNIYIPHSRTGLLSPGAQDNSQVLSSNNTPSSSNSNHRNSILKTNKPVVQVTHSQPIIITTDGGQRVSVTSAGPSSQHQSQSQNQNSSLKSNTLPHQNNILAHQSSLSSYHPSLNLRPSIHSSNQNNRIITIDDGLVINSAEQTSIGNYGQIISKSSNGNTLTMYNPDDDEENIGRLSGSKDNKSSFRSLRSAGFKIRARFEFENYIF